MSDDPRRKNEALADRLLRPGGSGGADGGAGGDPELSRRGRAGAARGGGVAGGAGLAARVLPDRRGGSPECDRARGEWAGADPATQRPHRYRAGGGGLVVRPLAGEARGGPLLWSWRGRHEVGRGGGDAGDSRA